ncbi:hypothetical protein BAR24066_07370 [Burkholderia arboris]|uniref:Uncharacterized protein n=1 Tax=Burkholderia arboris TaxID=488730 RepID=A0A9Q9SRS1_9BURK|nr:hypothetical protein [Burkholderia arboris]VWC46036.1 hypothetical protein BAR24066_07370 [Burkholderia arboris]
MMLFGLAFAIVVGLLFGRLLIPALTAVAIVVAMPFWVGLCLLWGLVVGTVSRAKVAAAPAERPASPHMSTNAPETPAQPARSAQVINLETTRQQRKDQKR